MLGGGKGTVVIIVMWGEPAVAEPKVMLQQLRHTECSPEEVVPGSWDPGSGELHRLPGGSVDSDLCLHTGFLVVAAAALVFNARLWCLS